ncbi:MAG: hypothetical protein DSY34_01360 [Desulfurobacterium sp.]|nr:MAG: hypothetical protein DSY34_01360 [Desulfurobacterium sp.]
MISILTPIPLVSFPDYQNIDREEQCKTVVATATKKHKHSCTDVAVAFETPLRLCPLMRTFQGNLREHHKVPFPTSV